MGYESYSFAVDLCAVGCIFAELTIGKPLLDGSVELEQLNKINRNMKKTVQVGLSEPNYQE